MRRRALLCGGPTFGKVDINNYLTMTALEDGLQASLSKNTCYYCVDGDGNWTELLADTLTPAIKAGQTLSFKANLIPGQVSGSGNLGIGVFTVTKTFNLFGNCMSMLHGDDSTNITLEPYAFLSLFSGNTTLIGVSSDFLPATTLASNCYASMFSGCTNLASVPSLTHVTATNTKCCYRMYGNCTSLKSATIPKDATLARGCYDYMFSGCTNLTSIPSINSKKTYDSYADSISSMFNQCTSLTSITIKSLTLNYGGGEYTFANCTKLASLYLHTSLVGSYAGKNMFKGCSNLSYIKQTGKYDNATSALSGIWSNVASEGVIVLDSGGQLKYPYEQTGLPANWQTKILVNNAEVAYNTITIWEEGAEVTFFEDTALTPGQTFEDWLSGVDTGLQIMVDSNGVEYIGDNFSFLARLKWPTLSTSAASSFIKVAKSDIARARYYYLRPLSELS